MPIKAPFSAPAAAPVVPAKPAPVAEKPQVVPAERELAAKLIAARDRLARAVDAEKLAKSAALEAGEKLEGAVAALRDARLAVLGLAREVGGADVADNFAYLTDEQAERLAKAGGLAALLKAL